MTPEVEERFAEIDRLIAQVDEKLRSIAAQNAAMSEMVEVLGSYVNTSLEALQKHLREDHSH